MNLSVLIPDADNPAITAVHPGIGVTLIFSFLANLINLNPGSFISGVPASDMMAIFFPSFIFLIKFYFFTDSFL